MSGVRVDAARIPAADVGRSMRANAESWAPVLSRPNVRDRPADDRWSPLEYACHVRDVFRLYDERLRLMVETDDPQYANWDQDLTAIERAGTRSDGVHFTVDTFARYLIHDPIHHLWNVR